MDPTYHEPVPPPVAPPAAPLATVPAPVTTVPTVADEMRSLRWGPIWAGLLTAIGAFFLMTLLAVALGLQAAPGVPQDEEGIGFVAIVVTSAIALIAFFIGGFVSSWSAGLTDQGRSLLNGFLVWSLWLVGVIVLAALGLGSFVGAVGDVFGQVSIGASELERQELVNLLRSGSWQTFLALVLTAAASALGGVVGAREEVRMMWPRVVAVRPRT